MGAAAAVEYPAGIDPAAQLCAPSAGRVVRSSPGSRDVPAVGPPAAVTEPASTLTRRIYLVKSLERLVDRSAQLHTFGSRRRSLRRRDGEEGLGLSLLRRPMDGWLEPKRTRHRSARRPASLAGPPRCGAPRAGRTPRRGSPGARTENPVLGPEGARPPHAPPHRIPWSSTATWRVLIVSWNTFLRSFLRRGLEV